MKTRRLWPIANAGFLIAATVFCPAAGAAALVDPRPDPDACSLLTSMDLEPLLLSGKGGVIDSASGAPAPGLATCEWSAQPQDHAADAVPRGVSLAFYHLADTTRARQQMDRQPHQDTRLSLAIGGEADDAIVRPSPTVVVARHGADIAVIDASRAELAEPDQQETRYVLDALALKAAGAEVRSPPWVEQGHVATILPLVLTGSIDGWAPPPHIAAAGADLLEPGIHMLKGFVALRVGLTVVLTPVALALLIMRRSNRWARWLGGGLVVLLLGTMLFGEDVVIALVNRYGSTGAAIVTGSFPTSTQYNRRDVIGYRVLIATADRRVVASEFRTDDFDVRGLGDLSIYPAIGDVFTVRYLPHHPQDFMIRNDDQSPWARKLACSRLDTWQLEARRKVRASPYDATFAHEAALPTQAERAAGCQ